MRFQLRGPEPNIFPFALQDDRWIGMGQFHWIGYQDNDHAFRSNGGKVKSVPS